MWWGCIGPRGSYGKVIPSYMCGMMDEYGSALYNNMKALYGIFTRSWAIMGFNRLIIYLVVVLLAWNTIASSKICLLVCDVWSSLTLCNTLVMNIRTMKMNNEKTFKSKSKSKHKTYKTKQNHKRLNTKTWSVQTNIYCHKIWKHEHKRNRTRLWNKIILYINVEYTKCNAGFYFYF